MITNVTGLSKVFVFNIEFQGSYIKANEEFDKLIQKWKSILGTNKWKLRGEKDCSTCSTHFFKIHITIFEAKYRDIYDESIEKTIERLSDLMEEEL